MIEFEFDPAKSLRNKNKHGIDFTEGQGLWKDSDLLEIRARTVGEPRFIVVGRMEGRHWTAVITYRQGKTRIISIRPARKNERELYESN